eukprot:2559834-Pleurochrysis_carterae.AAC.1
MRRALLATHLTGVRRHALPITFTAAAQRRRPRTSLGSTGRSARSWCQTGPQIADGDQNPQ